MQVRQIGLALAVLATLLVDHLLVERQALVVQHVTELLALGPQVVGVVLGGRVDDRQLVGHPQPVALETDDLLGVVRQQADRGQPQVDEDLGPDSVVAQVRRQPQLQVGVHSVEAALLQLVGPQLVEQAYAATFLREVEEHAAALLLDPKERVLELLAAVAAERMEHVAGQAFGVDSDQNVVLALHLALDHCDVVLLVDEGAEPHDAEVAELRRHVGLDHTLDELVVASPVGDQVADRDHLEAVPSAVLDEVRHASHRAVVVHDLADHARRVEAGEAR